MCPLLKALFRAFFLSEIPPYCYLSLSPQEAALYVQEGEDDAKFYQHPNSKYSKLAYDVIHHPLYHVAHLVVTVLLMLLAFAETPAVGQAVLDKDPHKKRTLITVSLMGEHLYATHGQSHWPLRTWQYHLLEIPLCVFCLFFWS